MATQEELKRAFFEETKVQRLHPLHECILDDSIQAVLSKGLDGINDLLWDFYCKKNVVESSIIACCLLDSDPFTIIYVGNTFVFSKDDPFVLSVLSRKK